MNTKQKLEKPIPLALEQYECQTCKKKFYINKEDQRDDEALVCPDNTEQSDGLVCPFCADNNVPLVREFDIEILAINDLTQV